MRLIAIAVALAIAWPAGALAETSDEDRGAALRAAVTRAQSDPAGALAELEALGARRPLTPWSDNAWSEAARLAEAAGDFARARRALEQVIAIDQDAAMVRRARATIARIAERTGDGRWDAIARDHERLVASVFGGGEPYAALAELAALVRANPDYPRGVAARVSLARGYEMQDDTDVALDWMRSAADAAGPDEPGQRTRLALARMAIRAGELAQARAEVVALRAMSTTDRAALDAVGAELATAERRRWIRRAVWVLLGVLGVLAVARLARDLAGREHRYAWVVALRRLARPPIEAWFMLPIAALVIGVAATGNPLVARAIITITVAGFAISWMSGVLIDVARECALLSRRRLALHLFVVALAVAGIVFLAVEQGNVLRLLAETWRGGHALR